MTDYGIDAASFQGVVDWAAVDATTSFGWEKVTQGTGYTNPYWAAAKAAMAARAKATGFVPGGYLFLEQGNGAGQADFFANAAGNMDGFAVAVDIEPSTTRPDMATSRACVARLRQRYPGKPIGGYIPFWYWDGQDTTFVDYLWASNYVSAGPASPATLHAQISAGQWAPYGGQKPALLQFTDKAVVAGVAGPVDCSCYEGTDLAGLLLGTPATPEPVLTFTEEDPMQWLPDTRVVPLAFDKQTNVIRLYGTHAGEQIKFDWVGLTPDVPTTTVTIDPFNPTGAAVDPNCMAARLVRGDLPAGQTSYPLVAIYIQNRP